MKSVVLFVLLFACLFALAQWAQNLDLSPLWAGPAEASADPQQAAESASPDDVDLLDWIDRVTASRPQSGSRPGGSVCRHPGRVPHQVGAAGSSCQTRSDL